MKNLILITLILLICNDADAKRRKFAKVKPAKIPSVKLGYFGRFEQPSFIVGAEMMFQKKQFTNSRFNKINEKFVTLNYTQQYDADIYNIGYLHAEYLKRSNYTKLGIFTDLGFGFGVGKTMNTDQPVTYIRNADGSETVKSLKTGFIMLTINGGVGYDFINHYKLPIKLYSRIGIYPIYFNAWPYQATIMGELGINTNLSILKRKKSRL
jgi:hypothetical protein